MKRLMSLDQNGTMLLSDILNQRIVRELVLSSYSTSELSRTLGLPQVKVWRRVSKLLEAKLIQPAKIDHVGNLEKKLYRASALKYVPQDFIQFEPKSKSLKEAFKTYMEIQKEFMGDNALPNEIPELVGVNPVDYGVYADLKGYCRILLNPRIRGKMDRLEKQLADCKEFEILPQLIPSKFQ
jgi:DNA-binding Lrp family transcriptional regulator